MSNELLDTLENKVFSAIETIELLRIEINDLKEERTSTEQKVQDLIQRIDDAESSTTPKTLEATNSPTVDDGPSSTFDNFGQPLDRTGTDY